MTFRLFIFLLCLTVIFLLSGCMTTHKVNVDRIDTSETYRIGIVKVVSNFDFPIYDEFEKKALALQKIQYEEICQVLKNKYGIKIDTAIINKKPMPVVEYVGGNPIKNAYFGNDNYEKIVPIEIPGLYSSYKRENTNKQSIIDIIYHVRASGAPISLPKIKLYYGIVAKKDEQEVFIHRDEMRNVNIPMFAIFNITEELEKLWAQVIVSSQDIDEALFIGLNK